MRLVLRSDTVYPGHKSYCVLAGSALWWEHDADGASRFDKAQADEFIELLNPCRQYFPVTVESV